MMKPIFFSIVSAVLLTLPTPGSCLPAFPGAEGAGSETAGGRGGQVYEVINLNDSGPGSLRAAVEAEGPRIVVFRVSGTIQLKDSLLIKNPHITIAGQTAPGEGICLRDAPLGVQANDVVVRFLRVRLGDESGRESDAISISSGERIIFDHCSASWSVDETLSASTGDRVLKDVTVQWCFITESLNASLHGKGRHGYGSLIRSNRGAIFSFHHNLYAHHSGRSPRPGNYDEWNHERDPEGFLLDFRNNLIYDYKGSHAGYNGDRESITKINYIGNALIRGVNSAPDSVAYKEESTYNRGFFSNNCMEGVIPSDPYSLVRFPETFTPEIEKAYRATPEFKVPPVVTDGPQLAAERVLKFAGAVLPIRDEVDARVVSQVRSRTGTLIDSQDQVGGWPDLESQSAPEDRDHDGMPDDWERERGLAPEDPSDGPLDRDGDGYTNVEEYLNWLVRPTLTLVSVLTTAREGEVVHAVCSRTGYTTDPLTFGIETAGTAVPGEDYKKLPEKFTLPRGSMEETFAIVTARDSVAEGTETIQVRIVPLEEKVRIGEPNELVLGVSD